MSTTPAPQKPLSLGVIFLTLYIDLIGFSIFFPLGPDLLRYYIAHEPADGFFAVLFAQLQALSHNAQLPEMATGALFAGLIGSIYSLMQFVFSPVWGARSDRVGRRPVLLLTVAGNAVSFLLLVFSGSFNVFLLSRILGGIMGGNLAVAIAAVADVTTREGRAKGMGIVGAAFALGFLTGPAIGGLTAHINLVEKMPALAQFGFHPFSAAALIGFALCLVNLVWVAVRFRETLSASLRAAAAPVTRLRNPLRAVLALTDPALRRANYVGFFLTFGFSFFETIISFFTADQLGFGPRGLAMIFIHIGLVSIFTQGVLVRRLVPRLGEKRTALIGIGAIAVAFVLLGYFIGVARSVPGLFVALTVCAMGSGFANVGLSSLISLYAGAEEQGRVTGLYRSMGFLARACSPAFAGLLFFQAGGTITFAVAGALLLLPLSLGLALPQPKK